MDDFVKLALEIVKAQASVRDMGVDEIVDMVKKLSVGIRGVANEPDAVVPSEQLMDPKKSLRENSVICLECGKSFKVITKKHLAQHNLTPAEYKEKYGMKKGTPLAAKSLQRARRKKMKEMKLWERRKPKAARAASVAKVVKPAKVKKPAKAEAAKSE